MRRALFLVLLLAGCATVPTPATRSGAADRLAAARGWQALTLPAGMFQLSAFGPPPRPAPILTVYIEGDGLAWLAGDRPSPDPTPVDPVALQLALASPGVAVYLARPCQYQRTPACEDDGWWTGRRFAPEVIAATGQALDQLKARYSAQHLILVGYSGGGAVAALVAARRDDVVRLVTVASPLDTAAWTRLHDVDPLTGSLNPADDAARLAAIPQVHFAGADDAVVPPAVAGTPARIVVRGFDHHCCWARDWPALATQAGLD